MSEVITLPKTHPVAQLCAYGTPSRLPEHVDSDFTTQPDGALCFKIPQHAIFVDLKKLNLSGDARDLIKDITIFTLTEGRGYSMSITIMNEQDAQPIAQTLNRYITDDAQSNAHLQKHESYPGFISVTGSADDILVLLDTIKGSNFDFKRHARHSAEELHSTFDDGPMSF